MRPMIVDSWRRVLATGLEPIDVLPSIEADPSETRERWLEHPLGLLRHVLVEPLQMLAVESNSVVQVTDPSGLTLYLGGPEWLKAQAAEMNLVEGARCSETDNGTNGVGTALATDRPVQVFAFEHFSHHHREWVCSGAPIHDRVSGRLVGVIDLSSPWTIAHPRSLELVTEAARRTEQCLLESRRDHDARLRRRYGDLATKTSELLVNREGYLLVGDSLARPRPLDIPENGGEIALGDGTCAVAEPLGGGEAYLVRRLGPRGARAAPGEALERAEERARELARERAGTSRAREPERAGEVERGLPGATAGEHLSAYLEAAIDCVVVADSSGRIVEFNPAAERTFGYTREQAVGRRMDELIVPPSLRERHVAAFERFVKTREGTMLGRRVELTGMRADGSEFPVELALSQVEAEPVLICGALRDISATKQAESRLRELAKEQAALRQVATLVAYESSPERLVGVLVEEVARVFEVPLVRLIHYEPTAAVVVGGFSESNDEPFPIGSRWQLDTPGLLATIRHTGRAAHVANYAQDPCDGAGVVQAAGMRSAVGSPIVVGGRVWGAIVLLSPRSASLPEDTGARLADFTDLVATALANAESRAALSQLADEQAALRRVATLVAKGAKSEAVFSAVAHEVAQVFGVQHVTVCSYEVDTILVLSSFEAPEPGAAPSPFPAGRRLPLNAPSLPASVHRAGEPVRIDDFTASDGLYAVARQAGLTAAVGVPIIVHGTVWGAINIASTKDGTFLPDAEERLARFTELVATSVSNATMREELAASEARARGLAREQAALRRVATLVAKGTSSNELFAAVTTEVADVLDVSVVALQRYEPDGMFTMVGIAGEPNFTVGSRWPVEDEGLAGMILATGRPARKHDYTTMPGPLGAALRDGGLVSAVGVPIVVDGSVWGFMTAGARPGRPTPDGTEERLARFTELVVTAIADSQAREQLAQLADEQTALRRVATMVARAPGSEELFSTVAREVAAVLEVPGVIVTRYDADGSALTVGEAFDPNLAGAARFLGVGARSPREPGSLVAEVFDTRRPARIDDFSSLPGRVGELARAARLGAGCAGPIVVSGAVWGKMCVFSQAGTVLPEGTEDRLHDFIELVATAIANYEARAELAASEARSRELADEQAALRRVATLVARGVSPEEIFSAVTNEMGRLFHSSQAYVGRFEPDGSAMVVVGVSDGIQGIAPGSRWTLEDYMASTRVYRTGRPARLERSEFEHVSGPMADLLREIGAVSSVGAPIVVEGQQWGFVTVTDTNNRLPVNAEKRLEKFTELLGTAIANADSRAQLAASRARIIAAGDDARRRIERDLHDGAQQQLVTLAVALRRAEAKFPDELDEQRAEVARVAEGLATAIGDLRELSRGIHPSVLTEGGLPPALKALGRRSPIRVKLDIGFEHRLPDQVEVAAYYAVAEALTNASKYSDADRVWISLRVEDDRLHLSIRDDGAGGADASRGTGLTGLTDRLEALGGRIEMESPLGVGTRIESEIPIVAQANV
jgi:PAS domain S-box-containing protein